MKINLAIRKNDLIEDGDDFEWRDRCQYWAEYLFAVDVLGEPLH